MGRRVVNVRSPLFLQKKTKEPTCEHGEEHDGPLGGTALR
jgi:hypothetical protein